MRDPDSTFWQRMDDLEHLVGKGMLHGSVNVDQVYARYQDGWGDEGDDTGVITPTELSHAPGPGEWGTKGPWHGKAGPFFNHKEGHAGFLSLTLTDKGPEYAERFCRCIDDEKPFVTEMIEVTENLAVTAGTRAPMEVGILQASVGAKVVDDDAVPYDRPPAMPRLPQEALDALRPAWHKAARRP